MKKRIVLLTAALVLISALWWVFTHGFIRVAVNNATSNQDIRYDYQNASEKTATTTSKQAKQQKLVRSGPYQVTVTQGSMNYVTVVNAGNIFKAAHVTATLAPEADRTFVGSNPSPCMYYLGGNLISEECGEYAYNYKLHVPATDIMPTYVDRLPNNNLIGIAHGIVTTSSNTHLILLQDQEGEAKYHIQQIQPDLSGGTRQQLDALNPGFEYAFAPFKDGAIAYDPGANSFITISGANNPQTTEIKIDSVKDTKLIYQSSSVQNDAITMLYTAEHEEDDVGAPNAQTNTGKRIPGTSEVIVWQDSKQQHFTLDTIYSLATSCGTKKLCAVDETGMTVYDIAGSKAKKLYGFPGVVEVRIVNGSERLITQNGIVAFDIESREGHLEYTFGKYRQCGFQLADKGYILCVISEKGGKTALFINPEAKDTTNTIDKSLLKLEQNNGVGSISVNRNIIYITPDYGELVYDANRQGNFYDKARKAETDASIAQGIKEAGIDQGRYRFITIGSSPF